MKKIKIKFIIALIMILFSTNVFAAESQIIINGDNTAKPGETKNITIKISSEKAIGVVSGKIEKDANISSITVTGKNNWNLTYNKETGVFNIYKAEGATNEEIINIEYVSGNTEGKGKITISDIKLTSIDYETEELGSISKEITIESDRPEQPEEPEQPEVKLSSIEITKAPNKVEYKEGEKFDIAGMEIIAKYTDGSTKQITNYTYSPNGELKLTDDKIIISYQEGEITKTIEQKIIVTKVENNNNSNKPSEDDTDKNEPVEDNTDKNKPVEDNTNKDNTQVTEKLPQTGETNYIIFIMIGLVAIISVSYIGYRKYNDIH